MWKVVSSLILGIALGAGGVYLALKGPLSQKVEKPAMVADSKALEGAVKPGGRKPALPSLSEAQALAAQSMRTFAEALREGKMDRFYASLSDYWKQRTSPARLDAAFAPMLKAGLDLTRVASLRPILEKGSGLTPKGDLLLKGHYGASDGIVRFTETYRYEKPAGWKLVSFYIRVLPKEQKVEQKADRKEEASPR